MEALILNFSFFQLYSLILILLLDEFVLQFLSGVDIFSYIFVKKSFMNCFILVGNDLFEDINRYRMSNEWIIFFFFFCLKFEISISALFLIKIKRIQAETMNSPGRLIESSPVRRRSGGVSLLREKLLLPREAVLKLMEKRSKQIGFARVSEAS